VHRLLILPLLIGPLAAPTWAQAACKPPTKVFQGEAPSAIVQQAFSERFDRPVQPVDCNDVSGVCTQTWVKKCSS
jgi:hypothetical protein